MAKLRFRQVAWLRMKEILAKTKKTPHLFWNSFIVFTRPLFLSKRRYDGNKTFGLLREQYHKTQEQYRLFIIKAILTGREYFAVPGKHRKCLSPWEGPCSFLWHPPSLCQPELPPTHLCELGENQWTPQPGQECRHSKHTRKNIQMWTEESYRVPCKWFGHFFCSGEPQTFSKVCKFWRRRTPPASREELPLA